ncbi:hypothetical protein SCP_1600340 [Sparassis crispa]|uniref:Uncharacterized protein n=1 Tax=Sparassis crispa TaxID=139825 RepID=A0A401H4P5_9APHY|nr:hypothetical protein SCP_1600340 [Sparassis crispa]GBE89373.1 hypothetical protein SCP_1600340 [Sparassis crispa]
MVRNYYKPHISQSVLQVRDINLLLLNEAPDDDLLLVSLLWSRDAPRLSETTRHLHLIALPRALFSVNLQTCKQLKASVHPFSIGDSLGHSFCVILASSSAHELRSIYMEDMEHLIYAAPRVGNALTELERLEDIHLYGVSNLVREILPSFRSQAGQVTLAGPYSPRSPKPFFHFSELTLQRAHTIDVERVAIVESPSSSFSLKVLAFASQYAALSLVPGLPSCLARRKYAGFCWSCWP